MTRARYNVVEALNRILRVFQDKAVPQDTPNTVPGEMLNTEDALSDLAELLVGSLPGETLTYPNGTFGTITTSGTITAEDVVVNDWITARGLTATAINAGTGTFYAGYGEVSIGGFNDNALLGNGEIVLGFGPASTIPSGTLSHLGGVLFAQDGALKWLGASGTVSTIAGS